MDIFAVNKEKILKMIKQGMIASNEFSRFLKILEDYRLITKMSNS